MGIKHLQGELKLGFLKVGITYQVLPNLDERVLNVTDSLPFVGINL